MNSPKTTKAWTHLKWGHTCRKKGQHEQAATHYQTARRLFPRREVPKGAFCRLPPNSATTTRSPATSTDRCNTSQEALAALLAQPLPVRVSRGRRQRRLHQTKPSPLCRSRNALPQGHPARPRRKRRHPRSQDWPTTWATSTCSRERLGGSSTVAPAQPRPYDDDVPGQPAQQLGATSHAPRRPGAGPAPFYGGPSGRPGSKGRPSKWPYNSALSLRSAAT